jgi:hypothetical protein
MEYESYMTEIEGLLALPADTNVRESWGADYEPRTPEERLIDIAGIFDIEGWDWPRRLTPKP